MDILPRVPLGRISYRRSVWKCLQGVFFFSGDSSRNLGYDCWRIPMTLMPVFFLFQGVPPQALPRNSFMSSFREFLKFFLETPSVTPSRCSSKSLVQGFLLWKSLLVVPLGISPRISSRNFPGVPSGDSFLTQELEFSDGTA